MKTSGVYIIAFGERLYVGSSAYIEKRWHSHRHAFRRGTHHNRFMQRLWNNGLRPVFVVALRCSPCSLLEHEQRAIDAVKPELNLALIAGAPMRGRKHSDATREKMRKSPEQRQALSAARKGCKGHPNSEEHKHKLRTTHPMRKAVLCVNTGVTFASRGEAARWLIAQGLAPPGNAASNIGQAARHPSRKAYGFNWVQA